MATCVAQNAGVVQEKVDTISSQVAVIIAGIKHKDIFPRLNRGAWKFSDKEAKSFATQLAKCVDENLMWEIWVQHTSNHIAPLAAVKSTTILKLWGPGGCKQKFPNALDKAPTIWFGLMDWVN
ncbi:hypothetical protein B0H16DRAFT_1454688 [Mycena metata]|uniref:Uncharacterized protein n=1 Tax=Mycena metata TaxID=1033252 RepID=A0AAD7JLB1_9AGAR|nr:hypothetical protein B0H16DRAFT_1454688 [Mycena metata]